MEVSIKQADEMFAARCGGIAMDHVYEVLPQMVTARQCTYMPSYFADPNKPDNDYPGDWLVILPNGTDFMISDKAFRALFALVEA